MDKDEMQRPEGKLVAKAIKASGRSVRKVAMDVGISDTRLRHIVNGYQPVGRGQVISIVGPAETLARVAEVLDITAAQMREAGREDVATVLDEASTEPRQPDGNTGIRIESAVRELREFLDDGWLEWEPPSSALMIFSDVQIAEELLKRTRRNAERLQGMAMERLKETRGAPAGSATTSYDGAGVSSEPEPER